MRLGTAGLVAAAATAWAGLLVGTPMLARAEGQTATVVAAVTYRAGAVICHQQRARSFAAGGVSVPVCARCLGLYVGGAAGAILGVGWLWVRRRADPAAPGLRLARLRLAMVVIAVPTLASWAIEHGLGLEISNLARAVAAAPFGAAIGALVAAWAGGVSFDDTAPVSAIH